jgi:hypothetical protein
MYNNDCPGRGDAELRMSELRIDRVYSIVVEQYLPIVDFINKDYGFSAVFYGSYHVLSLRFQQDK